MSRASGFVSVMALVSMCAVAVSCSGRAAQLAPVAYLKVVAEPPGATVYEQDQFLGSARLLAEQPKLLTPGLKYLTFKASGHFPVDLRLDLPPGLSTIKVSLRPVPP